MSDTPLNADEELELDNLLIDYRRDNITKKDTRRKLLADRKKHELQARLEEYQQGLMVGAMPEFIGKPMAEKRIAELKQELEKL